MYECSVYDIYQEPTPNCFITNNEKTKTKNEADFWPDASQF